jgi:hypothetical protein
LVCFAVAATVTTAVAAILAAILVALGARLSAFANDFHFWRSVACERYVGGCFSWHRLHVHCIGTWFGTWFVARRAGCAVAAVCSRLTCFARWALGARGFAFTRFAWGTLSAWATLGAVSAVAFAATAVAVIAVTTTAAAFIAFASVATVIAIAAPARSGAFAVCFEFGFVFGA